MYFGILRGLTVTPTILGSNFAVWVTCGVKKMSLSHGWGWQPPQTASCIHIINIQSVSTNWYAVHGYMAVATNSYTHNTWLRFWGCGSLVESKWCHYIMVEADSHLKLLPASILDMYTVFEHIDMLSMGIWQKLLFVIPTLLSSAYFVVLGYLWSQNDAITSWLRLPAISNCFLHPHETYTKCLSTLICYSWAYDSSLK